VCVCVCLGVNHGGINHSRCTQRLVDLHVHFSASYWRTVAKFALDVHLMWMHRQIHPRVWPIFSGSQRSKFKFSGNCGSRS